MRSNTEPEHELPRILIVEDNPGNLDLLRKQMESEPWTQHIATSGEAALEILQHVNPDLILLDIKLPGIDGITTCSKIKTLPQCADVPIIFVTADPTVLKAGFNAGGADYITKPIHADELKCRIRNHLRTRELLTALRQQVLARDSLARLGGMVSDITHEVNTPLGVCVTAASTLSEMECLFEQKLQNESLSRHDLDAFLSKIKSASQLINENAQDAASLMSNFKELAVDESSRRVRTVNLNEYLRRVVANIQPLIKHAAVSFALNIPETLELETKPGSLAQILRNLIINSVIHGFEASKTGLITITVSTDDDTWTMHYQDNGRGMPEDVRKRVFEKFFTTKANSGGSGIGSHIIRTVTERLGGHVELESAPSQGVRFIFRFPYTPPKPDRLPDLSGDTRANSH